MRTFAAAFVLLMAGLFFSAGSDAQSASNMRFLAFCTDGDGELSNWLYNRTDAYLVARDHERATRGHRWDVMVQGVEANPGEGSCALMTPGRRENTVRLQNTCGECRTFKVQRQIGEGPSTEKDITVQPGGRRYFRAPADAKINILEEKGCGD